MATSEQNLSHGNSTYAGPELDKGGSGPCTKLFYAAWSDDKLPRFCFSHQSVYTDAFPPQKEKKG